MSAPEETIWKSEPHTRAKHRILKEWWNAWLPILSTRHKRLVYFDGFAGPGVYESGEPGSPVVVISAALSHVLKPRFEGQECIFHLVERRADRAERLKQETDRLRPSMPQTWSIDVVRGDFVSDLRSILDGLEKAGSTLAPTFAFLDPFGFKDIPMELVSRLLGYKWCDLLVTFNARDISRFAESPFHTEGIDTCLGEKTWRDKLPTKLDERREYFLRTYEQEIRNRVPDCFVRSFEIAGEKGPIYYLVGATKHREGLRVMKRAMWVADPSGEYRFSDRTAGIKTLLQWQDEPAWVSEATNAIYAEFAGKTVLVDEVEKFVDTTPWQFKKRALLGKMTSDGRITEVVGGRKSQWPSGCSLVFRPRR